MEINKIYNENCLDTMARMPNSFIDLTVTSPPYDNLRTYKGYDFDFESIANELYRVTKKGGVVVWVVGDATIKGSETGTSFKQALYAMECGFNLGDTMIWQKSNPFNFGSNNFYQQSFEYMFVFTKGKIKTTNLIRDRVNNSGGLQFKQTRRSKTDFMEYDDKLVRIPKMGKRRNIFSMPTQSNKSHPAIFPEQLANDHIISWSNEGDLVYDPFMGSGTTAKMSILNNRNYIGSEISKEYCEITEQRLNSV
jgi:DNA modification methylase